MTLTQLQTKTRLLLGNITTTEYSDANLLVALNNYYDNLIIKAIQANKNWNVNGEIASTDIVAGQREYLLPTDLLVLTEIHANLKGVDNNWEKLKIIDRRSKNYSTINLQDSADAIDSATEIMVYDESLMFIEPPLTAVSDGLVVYYNREATALSSGTDIPNLPNFAHMGLVYGACMDYAVQTEQNKRIANFKTLYEEIEREVVNYYARRLPITKPRLTPYQEKYN